MKKVKFKMIYILLALLIALVCFVLLAKTDELVCVRYNIETHKLSGAVRVALVSDLHSCYYGEQESELTEALDAEEPDAVLLCGDIFDKKLPNDNAYEFLKYIAAKYPCYYVTGNHEYARREVVTIKKNLRAMGITVLDGQCERLSANGETLNICGIDDFGAVGELTARAQLKRASGEADKSYYTLLLSHRPRYLDVYAKYGFDLVLSGHTHGGQWRIPGLMEGFFVPSDGFFPKYVGGEYELDGTKLIVSRGLARESHPVPRIFNSPELVIIDLT